MKGNLTRRKTQPINYIVSLLIIINVVSFLNLAFFPPEVKASSGQSEPLIVDHTCTDISQIPEYWIEQAKQLKITYGHTSHGYQIVTGMNVLKGISGSSATSCNGYSGNGSLYDYCDDYYAYRFGENGNSLAPSGVLSFWDRRFEGVDDLGNPNLTAWYTSTRNMLNNSNYNNRNVVIWSWCGQVSSASETSIRVSYLNNMNQLEQDYPDVYFIYMTGHLDGTGEGGNLNVRNNQIRNYVNANNKILFDFADIESYDPDGNYYLDQGATDTCSYNGGNWANQWCTANPSSDLCNSCGDCAHSHCLNCNMKGVAFWWLLARIAGWEGQATVECQNASECDDGNLCTIDDCVAGNCVHDQKSCGANAQCDTGSGDCICSSSEYANCDGNWSNGCEVDLTIDNDNCGQCGNVCLNTSCQNGSCECVPGDSDGNRVVDTEDIKYTLLRYAESSGDCTDQNSDNLNNSLDYGYIVGVINAS